MKKEKVKKEKVKAAKPAKPTPPTKKKSNNKNPKKDAKKEQKKKVDDVSLDFSNDDEIHEEINKFKFDELTYGQWYKIVQYVINYDLILSNLERLDEMLERKKQLKAFLDHKGVIPKKYDEILKELNAKYEEMLNIQNEVEINLKELTDHINDKKMLESLKKELREQMVNKDNLKIAKDHVLFFRNPYFIDGDDQMFQKRKKALKIEYKNIKAIIKQLKPHQKKYLRNLDMFEEQIKKALFRPDFDFKVVFKFVRPFINNIIESPDYYYSELLAISLLE